MRMLLKPKFRSAIKISIALLCIPLIAWTLEFVYNRFIASRWRRGKTTEMILSNYGNQGYDYTRLNSLLRKVRRLEQQYHKEDHIFLSDTKNRARIEKLERKLTKERRSFTEYYYETRDLYAKTNMPQRLRRRLLYYQQIISTAIGKVRQMLHDIEEQ